MKIHRIIIATGLICALPGLAAAQTDGGTLRPAIPATDENTAKVVASGNVADEATRTAIVGKLRELYGERNVLDRISVGGVLPPPKWSETVEKILNSNIRHVHNGQLQVNGSQIALRGNVASPTQRQQISSAVTASLSPNYTIVNMLSVADSRQATLDKALSNRVVEFESGSANLTPVGQAILDDMAGAIKQINAQNVQLIGHTDNAGRRQANLALSLARANAVRIYLVAKGIPATSLSTLGAGPDQPVRSNDTPEGRAQNRRIEFRFTE